MRNLLAVLWLLLLSAGSTFLLLRIFDVGSGREVGLAAAWEGEGTPLLLRLLRGIAVAASLAGAALALLWPATRLWRGDGAGTRGA